MDLNPITKLAVLVDKDSGESTKFEDGGILKLITLLDNGEWGEEKSFDFPAMTDYISFRKRLQDSIKWLADVKIVILKQISGIAFTIYEGGLFSIWEMSGDPTKYYSYVAENELAARKKRADELQVQAVEPQLIERGKYFIDLQQAMESSQFSTKQVLMPFLKRGMFHELEVVCDHIPKWFDREFDEMLLEMTSEKLDNGLLKVVITGKKVK